MNDRCSRFRFAGLIFCGTLVGFARYVSAGGVTDDSAIKRFQIPHCADSDFSAYPCIDRLHDGRLLCVFSTRNPRQDDKLQVAATVSADNGSTWSVPTIVLNTPDGNDYDPSIIVVGNAVIVTATTTPLGESGITTSRIMAVRSDDAGESWSDPYKIRTGRRYTSGKVNRGIVLRDGTVLLGFTWEKNLETGPKTRLSGEGEMEEVSTVLMSFDRGQTWAAGGSVELRKRKAPKSTNAINGLCEPALVECDDGSIFMLCRTGLRRLYGCRSSDGGRSWSAPQPTALVGHNAPASLCRFGSNRSAVMAVWNNSPHHRRPLSVAASFDGCQTWTSPRDIAGVDGQQSSYPGCIDAADGSLIVVYQQSRSGGRDVLGVRFRPDWISHPTTSNGHSSHGTGSTTTVATQFMEPQSIEPCNEQPRLAPKLSEPHRLRHFDAMPKPITLLDGTLAALFLEHQGPGLPSTPKRQSIYAIYSNNSGQTWSEPETLVELPADVGGFGYFVPLVDQQGEIHIFVLCDANTGVIRPRPPNQPGPSVEPIARQRLDVWHVRSHNGRTDWTSPKPIWKGRAGDLQSVVQLSTGRIVLPVCYYVDRSWSQRGEGAAAFTYNGQFDTTVLYSDDGRTWHKSPTVLRTATPNLSAYGAVEPVVLELRDGRVWMLLRTQLGRFFESFSKDAGVTWSPASPSGIRSSDSPAALARLRDGRIAMLWNNCQRHPYAQGSRHVLHAAVSDDEGVTWHGYREVLRDPHRDTPPPPTGDHGVSYPFATVAEDGSVIYSLWVQSGSGRSLEKFFPEWLDTTTASDDFSGGLQSWSTFGTKGVELAAHPHKADRQVLSLSKSSQDWPAAAVWNFPSGDKGCLRIKVRMSAHCPPVRIELSNHFSPPFDDQSTLHSLFHTSLSTQSDGPGLVLSPGRWSEIELAWDCRHRRCWMNPSGGRGLQLAQQHTGPGPSYLRLSLAGDTSHTGRALVEKVGVDISAGNGPADVECLGPASPWTWAPPLRSAHTAFGCAGGKQDIYVVGGTRWSRSDAPPAIKRWLNTAWRFCGQSQQWHRLPDFPRPVGYALVVLVDDRLYVIGGRNREGVLSTTYWLRVSEPEQGWIPGPDLPRPLCRLRGGQHDGTIYALTDEHASGDENPVRRRRELIAFETNSGTTGWEKLADGPDGEAGYSAAAVCNGTFYVFGGAKPTEDSRLSLLDTTWAFDRRLQRWSRCSFLPFPLRDAAATALDGHTIAVIGGVMNATTDETQRADSSAIILSTQCLMYDVVQDRFQLAAPLHLAVADHGLTECNSHLWVVGGEDSIHRTRTNLVQRTRVELLRSSMGDTFR